MKLRELLHGCDYPSNALRDRDSSLNIDISGVAYDSRKVKEGYLFVAITGERYDGHNFIEDVIKRGAVAVVGRKKINLQSPESPSFVYPCQRQQKDTCLYR